MHVHGFQSPNLDYHLRQIIHPQVQKTCLSEYMRKKFVRRAPASLKSPGTTLSRPELAERIANTDVMFPNGNGRNWIQVAAFSCQRQVHFHSNTRGKAVVRTVWLRDGQHWLIDHSVPGNDIGGQPTKFLLDLSPPSTPALNLSQHQGLSNELALHIRWSKYWIFNFSTSLACWIRVALSPVLGILIKRGRFQDTDTQGEVAVMQLHKPRNNKNGWKIPDSRKYWGRILP